MNRPAPIQEIWWLTSRASGIIALALISLSVVMGLAMAARVLHRTTLKRAVARLHEHVALVAIAAIVIHGVTLLGDHWLRPGWRGIAVPFAMTYRPTFTGLGIIAGYLAALLGPSFYARKLFGARRWRKLHRFTVAVWVISVIHTLGAGSDRSKLWLDVIVLAPVVPTVYLLVLRMLPGEPRARRPATARPPSATAGRHPVGVGAMRAVASTRGPHPEHPGHAGRIHRQHAHQIERAPAAGLPALEDSA